MFKNSVSIGNQKDLSRKDSLRLLSSLPVRADSNLKVLSESSIEVSMKSSIYHLPGDKIPLAFKFDRVYPSLYYLWGSPCEMSVVYVNSFVSSYILNGAHLMLPGIIRSEKPLKSFVSGDIVAIYVLGNPFAIAIGVSEVSSDDVYSTGYGIKGKALHVVHFFGDGIWQLGDRRIPPGFSFETVLPVSTSAPTVDTVSSVGEQSVGIVVTPAVSPPTPLEMDRLILVSFLNFSKSSTSNENLFPMNASSLFSRVQASGKVLSETASRNFLKSHDLSAGWRINLKTSSTPKLADLIRSWTDFGFIRSKLVRGEIIILSLNFDHEQIRAFALPTVLPSSAQTSAHVEVSITYSLEPKWAQSFPDWLSESTDKSALCTSLNALLKREKGEFISPNVEMCRLLKIDAGKSVSKRQILSLFSQSLVSYYSLSSELPPRRRRGDPPKVHIEVKRIQNKFCTLIRGLATGYKLDKSEIASSLAKLFASAVSVVDNQIYCQGNVGDKAKLFLVKTVGIPENSLLCKK